MIQSSTSPWFTVMFGAATAGSYGAGSCPSTVNMNTVRLFELAGSDGRSEKYNLRVRTGFTASRHADVFKLGVAMAEVGTGKLDRGSGAAAVAMMFASGRIGSFSPAGPVSTGCVIRLPYTPT